MVKPSPIAAVFFDFTGTLAVTNAATWQAYADVVPALTALRRRGLHIGVLSNFDHSLKDILVTIGIHDLFDTVLYASALGAYKPDPAAFTAMADATGIALPSILYVGDIWDNDIAPCGPLQIPCLWLCRNGPMPVPGTVPSLRGVITTLTDILAYV